MAGRPSVVLVDPSWREAATLLGKGLGLPPERVVALPIGKANSNSAQVVPLIQSNIERIVADVREALRELPAKDGPA